MMGFLKIVADTLATASCRKGIEEAYYNGAVSREDLERRMNEVKRGEAPWQKQYYI